MYTVTADGVNFMGAYYDSPAGFALQLMRAQVVSVTDPNGDQIQGLVRSRAVGNVVYF